uniref:AMP-dependent synthetase/ligase domain-containing protein n=1 Tax=Entomoneis paludosa TaxID=265537 RepID=A0A7S2Y6D0_9STRA|mmetsp:Transcript_16114/g.33344  ORF Transcript_16114/g.33344 Transcript_16114/m.33344 type:complete len:659 (+) Transcript_16114:166-2142(+)|eukprot:CAMPEP_0172440390 /NCGR_PEP_ID=MMETSP1065-20121228/1014_1 /TAXON_ID=265537 /ORGANISM="Amphiprora paludosa, Strain CCMP125" /LENGTH=658 /DNA_ID=CAMNT_0013189183 /DNA_START=152 /DNA_END=2128 /DNA_ORIENTATION=-
MGDDEQSALPYSTFEVTQEVRIRDISGGTEKPNTVMENWDSIVARHGDKPALHQKINGEWKTWTWNEYRKEVDNFGKSLISLGFERFDIINILGFNSPEWFIANYGAMAGGGISAGIYATNNSEACQYVSSHSNAKVIVCDGLKQLEKYYDIAKDLPDLKALVMYGQDKLPADIKEKVPVDVYTFEDFQKLGEGVSDEDLKARSTSWKPGETCTLIYTSGTTGPPKGVQITNDNITWTIRKMIKFTKHGYMTPNDAMISYLPLSHIAAQMLDLHTPLESGCQIYFAQPDALKGSIGTTLKEVRPTIFFGVPRVWEKIYEKLQEVARSSTGLKKKLSTWAKKQAGAHWESLEYGSKTKSPPFYFLAKKLLKKAHVALGFDRCYGFYVSAAPIEVKILRYFMSLDIPIMELFGQSECCGPYTINKLSAFKIGTVGRPLEGTEGRNDPENGELQYRGRHIFAGYKGMEQETKKTIDEEGWMYSGDVVKFDDHNDPAIAKPSGFMTITGRIKELIITAGGENVPPVLIEDELKAAMPAISNAMVIGDKRKFLTVLITLHVDMDEEGAPTNQLCGTALEEGKAIGSDAKTPAEARNDIKWQKYFEDGIKKANANATSSAQRVQKFTLLDGDFSEKGTELTPTLKLKRKVAAAKYEEEIEKMYA